MNAQPKVDPVPSDEVRATITNTLLGGLACAYRLPIHDEGGASLMPIDLAAIPLRVVRTFLVTAPDGAVRGGHGHRTGAQLLVRIGGQIELALAHDGDTAHVTLDEGLNAVLIHSPVWSEQTYRGADAALMVYCDTPYDPASYIHERPV